MGLESPIYCIGCGYDIRANEGRCSECGREFDRADPRTFLRRPRRKWTRWLRRAGYLLLAVVLVLGAAWGWLYWGWKQEQDALAILEPFGVKAEAIGPAWLKDRLGPLGFPLYRTRSIGLWWTPVTDTELGHLKALSGLRGLCLDRTRVTDAELAHFGGMSRLESLGLQDTRMTDAGLVHLKGLSGLKSLDLESTEVTDAGVAELQKALPNCDILR